MSILFLTDLTMDAHALPVAAELGRRGHEVRVFNPGAFPSRAHITVHGGSGGQRATFTNDVETIDLADIRSVWHRRPGRFEFDSELPQFEVDWLRNESIDLAQAIWENSRAFWVSDPRSQRHADLKLVQLSVASQLGFAIPEYLVTNDPHEARLFVAAQPHGAIVKALSYPTVSTPECSAMIYTHRVTDDDIAHLDSVRYGPTYFQAYVVKRRDIRVTVMGDTVFAVAIDPRGNRDTEVDFRRGETFDLPHDPIDLPPALHAACLALTRTFGLQFGAIDLMETDDGDYQFLEINPNGQWYWIEMMTDLPMAATMAALLEQAGGNPAQPVKAPVLKQPNRSATLPVGDQTLRLPAAIRDQFATPERNSALVGTGVWLGAQQERGELHVGDIEVDQR